MSSSASAVARVAALHRFAVKGLERDELTEARLVAGEAFASDRRYAMLFDDAEHFDAASPKWIHKKNFLCAFTANELLASYSTCFSDATATLRVWHRGGEDAPVPLLAARLDDEAGREAAAAFFSEAAGRRVRFVSSDEPRGHAFGNTHDKKAGETRVVHIVNANTVAALSAACGVELHPERFRPNVILDGALPAWEEFGWVDRTVCVGGAALHVTKRTVRCEGVNADGRHGSGAADVDVPGELIRHFPEHGPYLGVYARVVGDGLIRVGDHVLI